METTIKPGEIEKILSEADELLNQLNSGLIEDMEETRRTQLEIYADELKKRRNEVQGKIEKGKISDFGSSGEGIHKAIEDIVTAMKSLIGGLT
jgi:hypothetical protein